MIEAKTQFDAGNLDAAIQAALDAVKSKPTDAAARTFLFELSCFSGNWERAEKQLEVIGHQDVKAMIGAKIFQQNFKAERDRLKVFDEGAKPEFMMPPPVYVQDLVVANKFLGDGKIAEARELFDKIEEERPAFACTVNGEEKEDFRDYNDSTMCIIEAIFKDTYVWLPMEQIIRVTFLEQKSLRDVYWRQAEVEVRNGLGGEMFVPSLYVNSFKSDDDEVRLGRTTNWRELGEDTFIGEGVRLFFIEGEAKTIFDLEKIEFNEITE